MLNVLIQEINKCDTCTWRVKQYRQHKMKNKPLSLVYFQNLLSPIIFHVFHVEKFCIYINVYLELPRASLGGSEVKASACNTGDLGSIPGSGRSPWRRKWQPTPVFLPGESHGQRSLVGYSPRGCKESDTTEWLHFTILFKKTLIGSCSNTFLLSTSWSVVEIFQ